MREYKKDNSLKTVICNKCGKILKSENDIIKEGLFKVRYQWGYFSRKDGQIHDFDLCEECYDEIVSQFAFAPEISESTEMI